jgi:hypothetical protein
MRPPYAFVLAALTCSLAACGSDNSKDSAASGPARVPITVTDAGAGKFTMSAPRSVKAGVAVISLAGLAGQTPHDAQFVRVKGDHTRDEVVKVLASDNGPIPAWFVAAGGPGGTQGGTTTTVTQRLEPGHYFVVDTGVLEADDPKTWARTAVAELDVTGDAGDATLPTTGAKISAADYSYTTSGLKAGTNRVTFANHGQQIHHVVLAPYAKGATLAGVKKAFASNNPTGKPPVDLDHLTYLAALDKGQSQVADLDLETGKYALVCFIVDRAGGPPHAAKGMVTEVTIPPS